MAGKRQGLLGYNDHPTIDPGTMCRNESSPPGSLGCQNDFAVWRVSIRSSQYTQGRRPQRTRPRPGAAPAAIELNIFGDFAKGPWNSDAEVLAAIYSKRDEWFPGKQELYEFAKSGKGTVVGAANVWNVLVAIVQNRPSRVNIFTHATDGYIGLSGTVVRGNVHFNRQAETALNGDLINDAEQDHYTFRVGESKRFTMKEVREALPEGAEIVIYACHSGTDKSYLRQLSKVFGAKVKGFSKEIRYYPVVSQDGKRILRWQYSHGDSQNKVSDFHQLQPDISAP
jgi:hypothetical protein